MASFYSLLNFIAVNGFQYSDPGSFDIISSLPLEVAITILRLLSGKDLLNVAHVNKKWFRICKSDSNIRQKIRRYLRQERRAQVDARLLGTSRRNGFSDAANRPVMMNIVNNRITKKSKECVGSTTSRYLPYRRESTLGLSRGRSTNRSNKNVEESGAQPKQIRM